MPSSRSREPTELATVLAFLERQSSKSEFPFVEANAHWFEDNAAWPFL
jgi:hypothetical protein